MKQFEFEEKLRQMRDEQRKAVEPFDTISNALQKEIVSVNLQINRLQKQLGELKINRLAVNERRQRIEKEHSDKIKAFIDENRQCMNNTWPDISTYTIVKQLRKRGWQGTIYNDDPDLPEDHKQGVIAAFTGQYFDNGDDGE